MTKGPLKTEVLGSSLMAVLAAVTVFSCGEAMPARNYFALGTVCSVNLFKDGNEGLYAQVGEVLESVERVFDPRVSSSEVAKVNAEAGVYPVQVGPELLLVTEKALAFAAATEGAFDPTVGPLVALWGVSTDKPRVPAAAEIGAALDLVNYRAVQVDSEASTIFLPVPGMALDFGGIAKGYAADKVAMVLEAAKVKTGVIDLGGNILVFGEKQDRTPWRVGVKDPEHPGGAPALTLRVTGTKTVVTSGAYERFFVEGGRKWHHILDPVTGYPVETDVLSATIVASSSMEADALSTGCFVMGTRAIQWWTEKGRKTLGEEGAAILLMDREHRLWATPDLVPSVSLASDIWAF